MWHKAEWMGRPMRLELTRVGLLDYLANRYTTSRGGRNYFPGIAPLYPWYVPYIAEC